MVRLIVSLQARSDIGAILTYLRTEAGPTVARNYSGGFERAGDLLTQFPGMGTPRPELGSDARSIMVKPYLLIYDHSGEADTVTLLRVVHGRRNITLEMIVRR